MNCVGTRERLLTIRIIEKIRANPTIGRVLGIEVSEKEPSSGHRLDTEKREE